MVTKSVGLAAILVDLAMLVESIDYFCKPIEKLYTVMQVIQLSDMYVLWQLEQVGHSACPVAIDRRYRTRLLFHDMQTRYGSDVMEINRWKSFSGDVTALSAVNHGPPGVRQNKADGVL